MNGNGNPPGTQWLRNQTQRFAMADTPPEVPPSGKFPPGKTPPSTFLDYLRTPRGEEGGAMPKTSPQEAASRGLETLKGQASKTTQEGIKQQIEAARPRTFQDFIVFRTKNQTPQQILESDTIWQRARELQALRAQRGANSSFSQAFQDVANIALRAHHNRDMTAEEISKMMTNWAAVQKYWR